MSLEAVDTGLRHVTFLDLLQVAGWRFKLYGMSQKPEPPPQDLITHGCDLIARTIPQPARSEKRLGIGFATIHAGETGDYVLINWWEPNDLLKHHLFGAPHSPERRLEYGWPRGVSCCIWEMAVPWFERNAWYRHVLSRLQCPDLDAYLSERLEGTV